MSRPPAGEMREICGLAASLVRDVRESRWSGLTNLRTEGAARPVPAVPAAAPPGPPETAPARPAADGRSLDSLRTEVAGCVKCPLQGGRKNTVFGEGSPSAKLMFVGEGPGADEDRLGRPFVGKAGKLLDDIIEKGMGLRREDVYIANVVKCRPPGNRNPEPAEIAACRPYLHAQIDLIRPGVIVALGKFAAQTLLDSGHSISRLRGRWAEYRGIRLMPTFHPSYLLRNPGDKVKVWEDIQEVMAVLGIPPKGRG